MHCHHWYGVNFCNNNPEDTIGKLGHSAQAMLQFGVKLVVLDNIGRSDNEFDPSSLKLPFGHTVEGMLSVNRSLIHYNQKEAAGGRDV